MVCGLVSIIFFSFQTQAERMLHSKCSMRYSTGKILIGKYYVWFSCSRFNSDDSSGKKETGRKVREVGEETGARKLESGGSERSHWEDGGRIKTERCEKVKYMAVWQRKKLAFRIFERPARWEYIWCLSTATSEWLEWQSYRIRQRVVIIIDKDVRR